jgi:hydroxymethylglutaryl-CoA lyase
MRETEIFIEENSPRDGIQNEATPFSIAERVELVDALSECGFKRIQIGSFVNPKMVPQMAGTERVFEGIHRKQGVVYSVLVLNEKGLERAIACGMEHVSVFTSASEAHSRRNNHCSVGEGVERTVHLIARAKDRGVSVQAGVMNAFGCRLEGTIEAHRVVGILRSFEQAGADELNLADSSGLAHPGQIEAMAKRVHEASGAPFSLHLHDTYGFGIANIYAAWNAGVTRFDASCGGLGGCPFIPGASGNVATEDVAHLFHSLGVPTGLSLAGISRVVRDLEIKLARRLPGRYLHTAGAFSLIDDTG